jgi:hypothetical protein
MPECATSAIFFGSSELAFSVLLDDLHARVGIEHVTGRIEAGHLDGGDDILGGRIAKTAAKLIATPVSDKCLVLTSKVGMTDRQVAEITCKRGFGWL